MSNFIYSIGASNMSNASTGRYHPDTDLKCGSLGYFEKERKASLMGDGSILGNAEYTIHHHRLYDRRHKRPDPRVQSGTSHTNTIGMNLVDLDILPSASARLVQANGVVFGKVMVCPVPRPTTP